MSRKTCPTCRQRWPQGKDPVEADANALMSLRIGDLVKGLKPSSSAIEAEVFAQECNTDSLEALGRRVMELGEAKEMLELALMRIEAALSNVSGCKVAMTAPGFVRKQGRVAKTAELETVHVVQLAEFKATVAGEKLRFSEYAEDDDGD